MKTSLVSALVVAIATASDVTVCKYGNGEPVAQPTTQTLLTCNPPAAAGEGTVEAKLSFRNGANYADVQVFTYAPKARHHNRGLAKIAAIATGADGGCNVIRPANASQKEAIILGYLEAAGEQGVDLAVLPENAFGRPGAPVACAHPAEAIDGPLVQKVAALAAAHSMYVVLPIHESRGARFYNTAVVIGRDGATVGTYSKVFPVFGNNTSPPQRGEIAAPDSVWPASSGVRAYDLDFGRVALLTCFDINFSELWHQAEALGADLVVWPSAMATPDPSSYGYARIFQYDVVAVGSPADFVGRDGHPLNATAVAPHEWPLLSVATVDVDRTFVHWDYNKAKVAKLLAEHPEVVVDLPGPPFYLLRSTSASTSVRDLCRAYDIETKREYIHRARRGLNAMRTTGRPPHA